MAKFNGKSVLNGLNSVQDFLNQNNPLTEEQSNEFKSDGFLLPAAYSSDGNGLPYSNVPSNKRTKFKRNIITWFVPEFGIARMYINPQSISYQYKKKIDKTFTKGGYAIQYWGEDLTSMTIEGTTGSSGIEGINMLYEIYRAEQYATDGIGLSLAASNSVSEAVSSGLGSIGNAAGNLLGFGDATKAGVGAALGGILGIDSPNANALASKNMTTLAQLALSVEMYYQGWAYRGFFESMTINERADNFLLNYTLTFVVTQRRGYRVNYFPWSRSPAKGPSQYDTPYSSDPINVIE